MILKRSPLAGKKIGNPDSLAINELPGLHTIDLRVAPWTSSQAAVSHQLGIDLPGKTGQSTTRTIGGLGVVQALCLAPDWWLVIGLAEIEHRLIPLKMNDQYHFSIVNVSGQRTTIEIEGPKSREFLAHIWEQDLREKKFPIGSVSQGLMAKAPVIVYHIGSNRYWVIVRSSFAIHLWEVFKDAAIEWI